MLSDTRRAQISKLCKLDDDAARQRAVSAFRCAVVDKGMEDLDAAQVAFDVAFPEARGVDWRQEIRHRHETKPLDGYMLRLGALVSVAGATGYGWHTYSGKRPKGSFGTRTVMIRATVRRLRELAGLGFAGQSSLSFL